MKPFRFRLARLERVRAIEESVARASWSRAEQAALEAERDYERPRDATAAARADLALTRGGTGGRVATAHALLAERAIDGMLRHLVSLRETARTRRSQADSLMRDWRVRKTDRRALEELHKKAARRHAETEGRREEREHDEAAILRARRNGAGRRVAHSGSSDPGGATD